MRQATELTCVSSVSADSSLTYKSSSDVGHLDSFVDIPHLQSTKIHATRYLLAPIVTPIPDDRIAAVLLLAICQNPYLLSQDAEDLQSHIAILGNLISNLGAGIEGIGIILIELECPGQANNVIS